jgi:hypothetical protein
VGLHICQINQRGSDNRGEWVSVANDGGTVAGPPGLGTPDFPHPPQHVHVYRFPPAQGGQALTLAPGQTAYIFTGAGRSERLGDGDLLLFAGRAAPVWNNTGDVAYLRNLRGEFVDSMTVGLPARHPNGH